MVLCVPIFALEEGLQGVTDRAAVMHRTWVGVSERVEACYRPI